MRLTRTVCTSVLTAALALSAAPALAADPPVILEDRLEHDGPWIVKEWPGCPRGERAVWVDRPGNPSKVLIDYHTGEITFTDWVVEFHGWECQPITLVPVGP